MAKVYRDAPVNAFWQAAAASGGAGQPAGPNPLSIRGAQEQQQAQIDQRNRLAGAPELRNQAGTIDVERAAAEAQQFAAPASTPIEGPAANVGLTPQQQAERNHYFQVVDDKLIGGQIDQSTADAIKRQIQARMSHRMAPQQTPQDKFNEQAYVAPDGSLFVPDAQGSFQQVTNGPQQRHEQAKLELDAKDKAAQHVLEMTRIENETRRVEIQTKADQYKIQKDTEDKQRKEADAAKKDAAQKVKEYQTKVRDANREFKDAKGKWDDRIDKRIGDLRDEHKFDLERYNKDLESWQKEKKKIDEWDEVVSGPPPKLPPEPVRPEPFNYNKARKDAEQEMADTKPDLQDFLPTEPPPAPAGDQSSAPTTEPPAASDSATQSPGSGGGGQTSLGYPTNGPTPSGQPEGVPFVDNKGNRVIVQGPEAVASFDASSTYKRERPTQQQAPATAQQQAPQMSSYRPPSREDVRPAQYSQGVLDAHQRIAQEAADAMRSGDPARIAAAKDAARQWVDQFGSDSLKARLASLIQPSAPAQSGAPTQPADNQPIQDDSLAKPPAPFQPLYLPPTVPADSQALATTLSEADRKQALAAAVGGNQRQLQEKMVRIQAARTQLPVLLTELNKAEDYAGRAYAMAYDIQSRPANTYSTVTKEQEKKAREVAQKAQDEANQAVYDLRKKYADLKKIAATRFGPGDAEAVNYK